MNSVVKVGNTKSKVLVPADKKIMLPTQKRIEIIGKFEPLYDEHMYVTGHYDLMKFLIKRLSAIYETGLQIGDYIVDIGAGSGVMLGELALIKQKSILNLDLREDNGSIKMIAMDLSPEMLKRAKSRIERRMRRIISQDQGTYGKDGSYKIYGAGAKIEDLNEPLTLTKQNGHEIDLLEVKFMVSDAMNLDDIPNPWELTSKINPDTIITSYCFHWFEDKIKIAQQIHNVLKPNGNFISIEEFPLVVTLIEGNRVSMELAKAIEEATTVIDIDELHHRLFPNSGLRPVSGTQFEYPIDKLHRMYANAYEKLEETPKTEKLQKDINDALDPYTTHET
ncbi:MAG: class I SAM-dependent methyltransferase [Candidatus Micrarchaeia archaeon]